MDVTGTGPGKAFMRPFLFDYWAYRSWMQREGNSPSVLSSYAGFGLAFYGIWVIAGLTLVLLPPMKVLLTYRLGPIPAFPVVVVIAYLAISAFATRFLRAREAQARDIYEASKGISYGWVVLGSAVILLPLPIALAVSRDSFVATVLTIAFHAVYVAAMGGFLLRLIRKPPAEAG